MDKFVCLLAAAFVASIALSSACETKLNACTEKMTDMGNSQPTAEDLKKICPMVTEYIQCLEGLKAECPQLKDLIDQSLAQPPIGMAQQMCAGGGCVEKLAECQQLQGGMASPPDNMQEYCPMVEKASACFEGLSTCPPEMFGDSDGLAVIMKAMEGAKKMCNQGQGTGSTSAPGDNGQATGTSAPGGDGDNSGQEAGKNKCDFSVCGSKKDCALFKCANDVKSKCDNDEMWKAMYTGDFKTKYDELKDEKCACGNLKPSLLIVLATAILMFLRSHC